MPYCSALTNHMCVSLRDPIIYTPCCRYKNSNIADVKLISYLDYKKSDFINNIKTNMSTEWDLGCLKCKKEEDSGSISLRQKYNKMMSGTENVLEFIELSVSNECNLACKMCNNTFSSKWQSIISNNKEQLKDWFDTHDIAEVKISELLNDVNLENLKTIKYLGGEPFITPAIYELFEYLKDTSKHIDFVCNTNCTFFPEKLLNKLVNFKSVYLNISVDGIGDLCNYIRTGSIWEVVLSNILKWKDFSKKNPNIEINIFTTAQAYNFHQTDEIKDFAKSLEITHSSAILQVPDYLSYRVLPLEYREEILNQLSPDLKLKKYLDTTEFEPKLFEKFKKYTIATDSVFNTSIEKTIPNLYKFF